MYRKRVGGERATGREHANAGGHSPPNKEIENEEDEEDYTGEET